MTSLLRACRVGVVSSALAALLGATALAQTPDQEPQEPPAEPPPGYILSIEGSAVLERGNTAEDAIPGMPLLVGDRLRSESGRIEVKWAERSDLRLARYTELDLLSRNMVRLPRGRLTVTLVTAPGQSAHDQLAIDAPGASVRFYAAGEYQITVGGTEAPEVELAVIRGSAQLASDRSQLILADGERSVVREGSAPAAPEPYIASASPDDRTYDPTEDLEAFQRSSAGGAYQGTSYLPTELYGYETVLNAYGTWQTHPSYGYVWYPRVAHDWRPYYKGRWSHLRRYGWTWIGAERWAWPTHHYGRWGFHGTGGFFWIPGRRWGPAWVSWAVAPTYVGWCPLGWDGRPVFGFQNFRARAHVSGRFDPWRGWTVIPSHRFGFGHDVHRFRVDHRVLVRERPAFITAWAPPRHPGRGVVLEHDGRGVYRGAVPYTGGVGRPLPPTRVEGSGSVAASAGYSGYYPGGYRGEAVPRDDSPYDRARRVMERRGDDRNRVSSDVTRPDSSNVDSPRSFAVPRSGVPSRRAQPNSGRAQPNSDRSSSPGSDGSGRGVAAPLPYRHAPGASRPPSSDDAPGMSRRRSSDGSSSVAPQGWSRSDRGAGTSDDDRSGGGAVPRYASPRSERAGSDGDGSRERSGSAGVSAPRNGGSADGGRSGSDRGRSDGGGAVRRHPR
jgi:hypothetical protein